MYRMSSAFDASQSPIGCQECVHRFIDGKDHFPAVFYQRIMFITPCKSFVDFLLSDFSRFPLSLESLDKFKSCWLVVDMYNEFAFALCPAELCHQHGWLRQDKLLLSLHFMRVNIVSCCFVYI